MSRKNTPPPHHSKLKSFKVNNYSQKSLFFNRTEEKVSKRRPIIVAETWKHYYFIHTYNDEKNTQWFGISELYRMEKSAMTKFVDIRNVKRLNELSIIESWIKNLAVIESSRWPKSAWLYGSILPEYLPSCSVLEVHYDEQKGHLLPDLVFCHPEIWNKHKSNLKKNEITRLEEKFDFHLEKSVQDPSNSVLIQLGTDLKALFLFLEHLKAESNKK